MVQNFEISDLAMSKVEKVNTASTYFMHRDKTRVQMPAKIFPHLKLKCLLFMGPTLGFGIKQRNSVLIKFGVF